MSLNLKDPISTPEAYEKWLKILIVLTVGFAIATVVSVYFLLTGSGDSVITILLALSTAVFFFAHREKSAGPRPGSPEYEALERQYQAKVDAGRERRYRKQHPHQVARELVESNKTTTRESYKDSKK